MLIKMENKTEISLINWRGGQTKAERLCASLLSIEGYKSIDPQCPLGGPDGLKDIVCIKDNWKYIGASYFPPTNQLFKDIKEKFIHDLEGVTTNNANGICFFTNQRITPAERKELEDLADEKEQVSIIYHIERIRAILDAPQGYGLRLEYLGIAMEMEEQLDFWSSWKKDFLDILQNHEQKFDVIIHQLSNFARTQSAILGEITRGKTLNLEVSKIDSEIFEQLPLNPQVSKSLTPNLLMFIHKLIIRNDLPENFCGHYRTTMVWIGGQNSSIEDALYVPIDPQEIPTQLSKLLNDWNENYSKIKSSDRQTKVKEIAKFHTQFILIHPFLDGNGRLSRILLTQQVMDLFDGQVSVHYQEGEEFYNALRSANEGDNSKLEEYFEKLMRDKY